MPIKPGPGDKKVLLLISGNELDELKGITWALAESFGLDRRIENYAGKRPIGLYSWDMECLIDTLDYVVDIKDDPDMTDSGRHILEGLSARLKGEYGRVWKK